MYKIIAQRDDGCLLVQTGPEDGFVLDPWSDPPERFRTFKLDSILARGEWDDPDLTAAELSRLEKLAAELSQGT